MEFQLARRHLGQHFTEFLLENNSCCFWFPKLLAPINRVLQTLRRAVTFGNKNNKCCFQQQSSENVHCLSYGAGRVLNNFFPIALKILYHKISELKLIKTLRPESFWPKIVKGQWFSAMGSDRGFLLIFGSPFVMTNLQSAGKRVKTLPTTKFKSGALGDFVAWKQHLLRMLPKSSAFRNKLLQPSLRLAVKLWFNVLSKVLILALQW